MMTTITIDFVGSKALKSEPTETDELEIVDIMLDGESLGRTNQFKLERAAMVFVRELVKAEQKGVR